jgi:putative chitinase
MPFTKETIDALWPHAPEALRQSVVDGLHWLGTEMISAPVEVAHFMAQVSHETAGGTVMEENLNYRADALVAQWPSHFTRVEAAVMAHKPQLIANQAYNGRMGNRLGSDDGWTYRGRGGTQTTGREAYGKLGQETGLDLLGHPELVISNFMQVSAKDFVLCDCLPFANEKSSEAVSRVTRKLNGGEIGLASREAWFSKWCEVLGV